jgi:photosystem II stability/assembly factor-like uncharacterized protein
MRFTSFAAALLGAAFVSSAARADGWTAPECRGVHGAPSVTATGDEGATLAPTQGRMDHVSYTFGLAPLERANVLLATVDSRVIRSTDAGCTWAPLLDLTERTGHALLTLTPARDDAAWAWAVNDTHLSAIVGDRATTRRVPGDGIAGFAVDPRDGRHLRYGDSGGSIWDSRDGGRHWQRRGGVAATWAYRIAFDPSDIDHVVLGSMGQGAFVSTDGGVHWNRAGGVGPSVNVFNLVVAPADPSVVWAMGLDLDETGHVPSDGRHLYRSTDGGLTYVRIVDQDSRITLINGPLMVPHPTDAGVLYFVFGMHFGGYGTDLYRYDAATAAVTLTHNGYDEVGAIAFHPADPRLMYLGLASEIE